MARKKKEPKIYTHTYKEALIKAIMEVSEVIERKEELIKGNGVFLKQRYINGFHEHIITDEIRDEHFKIEDNTLTLIRYETSTNNTFELKTIPEPEYNWQSLLEQRVMKLPTEGHVLVKSMRGKVYSVELAPNCDYNKDELLHAPREARVKAYIVTKTDPWICAKIRVELPESDWEEDEIAIMGEY